MSVLDANTPKLYPCNISHFKTWDKKCKMYMVTTVYDRINSTDISNFYLIPIPFLQVSSRKPSKYFLYPTCGKFCRISTNTLYPELSSESKLCPNSFLKLGRNFHERRHYSISWSVCHACFTSAIHDFASDLVHPETNLVIWTLFFVTTFMVFIQHAGIVKGGHPFSHLGNLRSWLAARLHVDSLFL